MLRSSAVAPDGTLAFDEHTAPVEDVDLRVICSGLKIVVGNPVPGVLEVS